MRISKLFINRQVADHPITRSIQSRLKLPPETVSNAQQAYEAVSSAPDPVQQGKETLYLTRNRGAF
jgi:spore photoproduct lyase